MWSTSSRRSGFIEFEVAVTKLDWSKTGFVDPARAQRDTETFPPSPSARKELEAQKKLVRLLRRKQHLRGSAIGKLLRRMRQRASGLLPSARGRRKSFSTICAGNLASEMKGGELDKGARRRVRLRNHSTNAPTDHPGKCRATSIRSCSTLTTNIAPSCSHSKMHR